MAKTTISQAIGKLKLGNADKIALVSIFNAMADDLEALRAKNAVLTAKLDNDAGVTDTNYTSLASIPAGGLSVGK